MIYNFCDSSRNFAEFVSQFKG